MLNVNQKVATTGGVVKDTIANTESIFVFALVNLASLWLVNAIKTIFVPTAVRAAAISSAPYAFAVVVPGTIAASITYDVLVNKNTPSVRNTVNYGMVGAMAALGMGRLFTPYASAVMTATDFATYAGLVTVPTAIGAAVGEQIEKHTRLSR